MLYRVADINDFTELDLEVALSQMPKAQQEHINKKRLNISKKQSIASRILVKNLLSEFCDISDGYNIGFDLKGKPYYLNSSDVHISMSHSGNYVAAAVSNNPIGIDIQIFKSINKNLVNKVCTFEEADFVCNSSINSFFKLWTVKEAYTKCTNLKLADVFRMSFVKDGCVYGLDKNLISFSCEKYELSIIE